MKKVLLSGVVAACLFGGMVVDGNAALDPKLSILQSKAKSAQSSIEKQKQVIQKAQNDVLVAQQKLASLEQAAVAANKAVTDYQNQKNAKAAAEQQAKQQKAQQKQQQELAKVNAKEQITQLKTQVSAQAARMVAQGQMTKLNKFKMEASLKLANTIEKVHDVAKKYGVNIQNTAQ